jgi:transcriptional regulator with XRE-family HTH domain
MTNQTFHETNLGDLMRRFRLHRGLSREQLAEKMGYDPASITRWENRSRVPTLVSLRRWIETMDLTVPERVDVARVAFFGELDAKPRKDYPRVKQ